MQKLTDAQHFALAFLVGLIAGLLMARAGAVGLDRALPLWIVVVLLSGVILDSIARDSIGRILFYSFAWGFAPLAGVAGYITIRSLASGAIGFPDGLIEFSGHKVHPKDLSEAWPYWLLIGGVLYITSAIGVSITTLCGRMLAQGAGQLFNAGPAAVEKVRNILIALGGAVAAIYGLWSLI